MGKFCVFLYENLTNTDPYYWAMQYKLWLFPN